MKHEKLVIELTHDDIDNILRALYYDEDSGSCFSAWTILTECDRPIDIEFVSDEEYKKREELK